MTRFRRHMAVPFALALALSAVACGNDDTASGDGGGDTSATVAVDAAWARTSPIMATNGAVYMELTSSTDDRLVAARVDASVAAASEVHETVMDPDSQEMAMRETDAIALPAGETVALEPGGFHVMLLDLVEPLEPGTSIEVTLVFDRSGEVTIEAEVRDSAMHGG